MAANKHLPITDEDVRRRFERAFRKTEKIPPDLDSPCWLWQNKPDRDGYGNFRWNGILYKAHRFSYMLYVAESENIEPGMDVDHRCEIRKCVNPDHLELVTHHENIRRQRNRPGRNVLAGLDDGGDDENPLSPLNTTEPERVLESIEEMLKDKPWTDPITIASEKGTPWRDVAGQQFDPSDQWMRAALLIWAVERGVRPRVAASVIFNATPYMLDWWSRKNAEWKNDINTARVQAREQHWQDYRESWFETAERRMPRMSADELARHGRLIVQKEAIEADERRKKSGTPALNAGGNNYFLIVKGDPAKLLDEIIETTAREVHDDRPSLPPSDEDDEPFD